MTAIPQDDTAEGLAGLEAALRDAAARAMKTEAPLLLALAFFRCVTGLARCLRVYRRDIGLSRGLSPDLIALLNAVRNSACRRLSDPALHEKTALRLSRAIDGLARAASLALPPAVRSKAVRRKDRRLQAAPMQKPAPVLSATATLPAAAAPALPNRSAATLFPALPAPPAPPRSLRADLNNLGAYAKLQLHDNAFQDAMLADAVRLALRKSGVA